MQYTNKQLEEGTNIETTNTQDSALARKIAASHLREDAGYYDKLKAAGVEECGDCGCGDPSDNHDEAPPAVGPNVGSVAAVVVAPGSQASQQPLSSSNLGKGGVNKPLKSDNLEAPEAKKVGANKVASTKTPPLGGGSSITTDSASDPMDHFGSAIVGLAEGGSQIKKK